MTEEHGSHLSKKQHILADCELRVYRSSPATGARRACPKRSPSSWVAGLSQNRGKADSDRDPAAAGCGSGSPEQAARTPPDTSSANRPATPATRREPRE
jgi:hypothetical protein